MGGGGRFWEGLGKCLLAKLFCKQAVEARRALLSDTCSGSSQRGLEGSSPVPLLESGVWHVVRQAEGAGEVTK